MKNIECMHILKSLNDIHVVNICKGIGEFWILLSATNFKLYKKQRLSIVFQGFSLLSCSILFTLNIKRKQNSDTKSYYLILNVTSWEISKYKNKKHKIVNNYHITASGSLIYYKTVNSSRFLSKEISLIQCEYFATSIS